jgi:hypothetical protein
MNNCYLMFCRDAARQICWPALHVCRCNYDDDCPDARPFCCRSNNGPHRMRHLASARPTKKRESTGYCVECLQAGSCQHFAFWTRRGFWSTLELLRTGIELWPLYDAWCHCTVDLLGHASMSLCCASSPLQDSDCIEGQYYCQRGARQDANTCQRYGHTCSDYQDCP